VSRGDEITYVPRGEATSNCAAEIPSTLNTLSCSRACKRATAVANRSSHPRHPLQNRCSPILLVYLDWAHGAFSSSCALNNKVTARSSADENGYCLPARFN
jgi:hypothetical protein